MYIEESTQEYPLSQIDVQRRFPDVSFPTIFTPPDGYALVNSTPAPSFNASRQSLRELPPQKHDGLWVQQWCVDDLTQEQISAILAAAKASKNVQINQWRLKANNESFTFAGKHIATDDLSMRDILVTNGRIANRGTLPPEWLGGWKALNNSVVAIPSVAVWMDFIDAMYDQGNTNFKHAQMLKTALAAAETVDQVNAIVW